MSRGATIIVSAQPRGRFIEGVINDTSLPGTIMQIDTSLAQGPGGFAWKAANSGTDGKEILLAVLLEDDDQGKTITDAYVAGRKCRLYVPISGEEMNMLLGEVAGTGNTYAIGDRLMTDAEDGILVPDSGSPQATVAVCLETLTQVVGKTLAWVLML